MRPTLSPLLRTILRVMIALTLLRRRLSAICCNRLGNGLPLLWRNPQNVIVPLAGQVVITLGQTAIY